VNVGHLHILDEVLNISRQASDEDVAEALKKLPTK